MSTKEEPSEPVEPAEPVKPVEGHVISSSDRKEDLDFEVPTGNWRHGLCDCFSACFCPCMMGWCCSPTLLGQILERVKFNFIGMPNGKGGRSGPLCMIFFIITIIFLIIEIVALAVGRGTWGTQFDDNGNQVQFTYANGPVWYQVCTVIIAVWGWYIFIVGCCTRMNMRKKYNLKPMCCGDNCCDDCCTAFWCGCCSTIQMARHTHDEDKYPYQMTAPTGLSMDAPEIMDV